MFISLVLVSIAIDDQKERQGIFMPGSRISVQRPDALKKADAALVCLMAVNSENEAKVSDRLRKVLDRPLHIVSVFALADIWRELDRLEAL